MSITEFGDYDEVIPSSQDTSLTGPVEKQEEQSSIYPWSSARGNIIETAQGGLLEGLGAGGSSLSAEGEKNPEEDLNLSSLYEKLENEDTNPSDQGNGDSYNAFAA